MAQSHTNIVQALKQPSRFPIVQVLKQPSKFPTSFDYEILRYLTPSDLLRASSVAKVWYKNAIKVFWDVIAMTYPGCAQPEYDPLQCNLALYRALISAVACQNAYSISRIDNLLAHGADLTARWGCSPFRFTLKNDEGVTTNTIILKNPSPLTVAAYLAEEGGSHGAAILRHLVTKRLLDKINACSAGTFNLPYQDKKIASHIKAFLQQQSNLQEEMRRQTEAEENEINTYRMSDFEEKLVIIWISLSVLAIPAIITGVILAPLTTMLIASPFLLLSFCQCCTGTGNGMLIFEWVPLISSLVLLAIGVATAMLTSLVGPATCGIIMAGLSVLAGLYIAVLGIKDYLQKCEQREARETLSTREEKQTIERDAKQFQTLAKSAKCRTEPYLIDTFSGGLLHTMSMWRQTLTNHNTDNAVVKTENYKNTPSSVSRGCSIS